VDSANPARPLSSSSSFLLARQAFDSAVIELLSREMAGNPELPND
jgi:hypothetical protein